MIITDTYVRGGILSLSVAEENEPPGFVTFLSQGVAAGALMMFQFLVWGLLLESAYYGLLFIGALPRYLGIGAGFGVIEAITIWACTYVAGRRLNVALRLGIALVVLAVLRVLIYFILWEPLPDDPESQIQFLIYNGLYLFGGVIFGLLIGSRLKPLNELARGVSPSRWRIISAITGFILRFATVVFLLYSIVIFVWMSRANSSRKGFVFAVITLSYFIAAFIILFVRMPFWLLLPLALIVNFPVVTFINDVIKPEDVETRTIALSYLVVWAAFLSCRVQLPATKAHKAQNENNLKGDEKRVSE